MRFFLACVGAAAIVFAACGGTVEGDKKQSDQQGMGTSGVCCPIKGSSCGCAGGGGWKANADECDNTCTTDWAVKIVTDNHGCQKLESDPSKCCGCPRPPG